MSDGIQDFNARLRRIHSHHARLDRGYVGKVRSDGLIVFRPRRRRAAIPWRGFLYLGLGFVFFKAVLFAYLGDAAYEARVVQLAGGHGLERAGAVVMRPDALTRRIALHIAPILR